MARHRPRQLSSTQRGYGHRWRKLRLAVLARDGYGCHYCGGLADSVDHVIPKSQGGTDDPSNLVAACIECNSSPIARHVEPATPRPCRACGARHTSPSGTKPTDRRTRRAPENSERPPSFFQGPSPLDARLQIRDTQDRSWREWLDRGGVRRIAGTLMAGGGRSSLSGRRRGCALGPGRRVRSLKRATIAGCDVQA